MKIQRLGTMASLALVGSIALTACGSDNNTGTNAEAGGNTASATANEDCFDGTLNVEGSSAQKNAIEEVAAKFGETCSGATINYNPSGSGAGIKQFIAGQVDFAGSDSALKTVEKDGKVEATEAATYCGSPAWNIPLVTGPIAVAYNVEGVDKLNLTPAVAGDIFSGKITTWNDPKIAAINSGTTLPATAIKVFFRSDESGTTENFTKYLKAAAPANWAGEPSKSWDGKGEGKAKSAGVAEGVKSTDGGITYVEWSYAKDNNLGVAAIDNGAGPVELNSETVGTAVATAEQTGTGNDLALKLDYATKEPGAYPINLVTYEIVCSKGEDAETQKNIKAFLKFFASEEAQKSIEEIGYAPLPPEVQTKVETAIEAIS
ncbi:phosphate ABC transporter substrate-binding protein [Knoellia sinensis KCTC 19936]|uniref:Phosphate-binding protein n=1 Tax=Knoellia sinensis KCTC 19936 TaxID=1385520 RepID=A0A0A0JFD0_9MICO|nr:phosphate ABC transporter substrate-binding protein PstS [Knoellia sinensis]KGN34316.1 phosphate ABC transporter substrate-binding protein [Knoellia sinensis KCTC 19936]